MATIKKSLSAKKTGEKSQLMLRVIIKRNYVYRLKSRIWIERALWDDKKEDIKIPRDFLSAKGPKEIKKRIDLLCIKLLDAIDSSPNQTPSKEDLEAIVTEYHSPTAGDGIPEQASSAAAFFDVFDKFLSLEIKRTDRRQQFLVLKRMLQRFECLRREAISIETFCSDDMHSFHDFLSKEHTFFDSAGKCIKKYQYIYELYPETRIKERGENAIHSILKRFRTFYNWAQKTGECSSNPFKTYRLKACVYGTPFYLSKEERDTLYNFDLSHRPALAIQRDIFVFQSLVGMRIGDLYRLTKQNVTTNKQTGMMYIRYIPSKTLSETGREVTVPLSQQAINIIQRYEDIESYTLLPFISTQKYNACIKESLRLAGINRIVTILNPTTRQEEQKQIWEVASSHMARRNFIGILYPQVKDPDIIASMTGHVEGSKAFTRYRAIDDNLKEEVIDLL